MSFGIFWLFGQRDQLANKSGLLRASFQQSIAQMPISSAGRVGPASSKNQEASSNKRPTRKLSQVKSGLVNHISSPSSTASSLLAVEMTKNQPISLAGQTIRLAGSVSTSQISQQNIVGQSSDKPVQAKSLEPSFFSATQFSGHQHRASILNTCSSMELNPNFSKQSQSGSTCPLNQQAQQQSPLSIKRNVNLKYIKTIIVALMAIDLLITVLVHQFAQQDHISIWLFGLATLKLRFSLLNLLLSSVWFVLLIGAILFDIYIILLISCLLNAASFIALLGLSVVHFSRRLDYNTIQLTSLLILLFSIVLLHVYLLTMLALSVYLTIAVKRRKSAR